MKPFVALVSERALDPERCLQEAGEFLKRYSQVSVSKFVQLEQCTWLAALVYLGMEEAKKQLSKEGKVINIVADSTMEPRDHVA